MPSPVYEPAISEIDVLHTYILERTATGLSKQQFSGFLFCVITRWFKYDREKLWLVYTQSVPVIFEPPCILNRVPGDIFKYSGNT